MFKFKSQNPYWTEFSSYQTFQSVDQMIEQIKIFESTYELTPSVKAVLNTIKLHAKRFVGVCWLYREEIAKKAGVSLSSVKRALKGLAEAGILTINSLSASDRVVAMFEASVFCYSALGRFLETCWHIREKVNPKLAVAGILRGLIDARRTDNKALISQVEEMYGELCFGTVLTRNAAAGRLPLVGFENNSELDKAVMQYELFLKELMERVK